MFQVDFLDNAESVNAMCVSTNRSQIFRRVLAEATVFVVFAPAVLDKIASKNTPRGCGVLRVIRCT